MAVHFVADNAVSHGTAPAALGDGTRHFLRGQAAETGLIRRCTVVRWCMAPECVPVQRPGAWHLAAQVTVQYGFAT